MAWLTATYRPVSLFSLRASQATSSGGRTNLVPSMYAVKMALVDAAFRRGEDGAALFDVVKPLAIRFEPPAEVVVSNAFIKIRREPKERRADSPAYIPTVGYREFCYFVGDLGIALDVADLSESEGERLTSLFPVVNYLGKRGSFFQFLGSHLQESLPPSFGQPLASTGATFPIATVVQYLDDVGKDATWRRVNSYSEENARLGRDRVFVPVAFPYQRLASSRGYTRYVRTV